MAMARCNKAGGYQQGGERLLGGHLKRACRAQDNRQDEDDVSVNPAAPCTHPQDGGHGRLTGDAHCHDGATMKAIGQVPCGQGQDQCGYELQQSDETQVPSAGREVVHLPRQCNHQHLVR